MAERERIARYFAPLTEGEPGSFFLTDDAAILTPPAGMSLVVTTDSVIESIHVFPGATPPQFAQKLMRRNLSDLAAMGATPWRYTINLHTPYGIDDAWIAAFATTLQAEQRHYGLVLIGGDSTSGESTAPIHVTMTCFGLLDGASLRRNGAQIGDDIYTSGTLGDAALALSMLQQSAATSSALLQAYHAPEPRLALGQALRGIATAALDLSDGLSADLAQLCAASHVGAQVNRKAILRSPAMQQFLDRDARGWDLVLGGGDDYELCFTAPKTARATLQTLAKTLDLPLTRIGVITSGDAVIFTDEHGTPVTPPRGWEHG